MPAIHPMMNAAIVSNPDRGYPFIFARVYIARVKTKAATEPDSMAFGRATVLPVTSLTFSMVGL